jgi:pimeloyl-ACP methyl ester carboxylesterase
MKRVVTVFAMLLAFCARATPASADMIGIVLMHGKTGSPNSVITGLSQSLQGAGHLVDTPEMCWSQRRIYDRPFLDCLTEIDAAIGRLKGRGARRIVVAGMSQGGDAALVYGARHPELAGIVALAPAAAPEYQVQLTDIAKSVAEAKTMVAAGRGSETGSFADRSSSTVLSIRTTAAIYLSYLDPQGPANMFNAVRSLRAPLLWVAGTADPSQTHAQSEFARVPANPLNRFVTVSAAHLGTPDAARDAVLAWLPTLR